MEYNSCNKTMSRGRKQKGIPLNNGIGFWRSRLKQTETLLVSLLNKAANNTGSYRNRMILEIIAQWRGCGKSI